MTTKRVILIVREAQSKVNRKSIESTSSTKRRLAETLWFWSWFWYRFHTTQKVICPNIKATQKVNIFRKKSKNVARPANDWHSLQKRVVVGVCAMVVVGGLLTSSRAPPPSTQYVHTVGLSTNKANVLQL